MLLAWRNWLRERLDASRLAPTRTSRDRRLAPPRSPLGREYARWLSDFFRSVCEWLRQILLGASHLHRAASHAGRETGLTSTGRLSGCLHIQIERRRRIPACSAGRCEDYR